MKQTLKKLFQNAFFCSLFAMWLGLGVGYIIIYAIGKPDKPTPFYVWLVLAYTVSVFFYLFVRFLAYKTRLFRKMKNKRSFTIWTTIVFAAITFAATTIIWLVYLS